LKYVPLAQHRRRAKRQAGCVDYLFFWKIPYLYTLISGKAFVKKTMDFLLFFCYLIDDHVFF